MLYEYVSVKKTGVHIKKIKISMKYIQILQLPILKMTFDSCF